ncbi:MAG: glutathione S-transferase N-terminal domain-containing protein [Pseudomonadota bacterium]
MIDFYYWPTPNGWKVSILLEELGLPYTTHYVNIGAGDQFEPAFLAISPNNRMPAIVDQETGRSVFESGAILWYLAEKTEQFIPKDPVTRTQVMEWVCWQTGNLGPMAGQHSHFWNYAPEAEKTGYAAMRYRNEYIRCLGVIERHLEGRDYLAGAYSIADMMSWPWVLIAKAMGVPLDDLPRVSAWRQRIKERPAVQRGVALGKESRRQRPPSDEERARLFGQK